MDRSGKAAGTVWFSAAFLLDSSHVFARLRCYAWSSRGSEVGMSFTEQAESLRAKAHLSGVRLPVLVGVTALAVVVLVAAGTNFLSVFSSDSLVVEKAGEADVEGASPDRPQEQARTIVVHVGGSVLAPGVYELAESARVQDAIEAAGGFGEQAATDALNLARVLTDGEHVVVPTLSEVEGAAAAAPPGGAAAPGGGKVNINAASAAELDALPGIGMSTAEKIVADRQANGPFAAIEDLKRVSGIGDKKYAALADSICVG